MRYYRVRSYFVGGKWTGADHLYLCENSLKAIDAFRKEYPEHDRCIVTAEEFDKENNRDLYKVFVDCGCVHFVA